MTKNSVHEIIIHAGLHKTATSTIQNCLADRRNTAILLKNRCLYPKKWPTNHSVPVRSAFCDDPQDYHMNIRKHLTEKQVISLNRSYLRNLEKEVVKSKPATLVISGEAISSLNVAELQRFRGFLVNTFSPKNIRVILYVRNPVDLFVSRMQQVIKNGSQNTTEVVIEQKQSSSIRDKIENITRIFGNESLHVYAFEKAKAHDQGPAGHFLSIAGFCSAPQIEQFHIERSNESISLLAAKIIAFINTRLPLFSNGVISKAREDGDTMPLSTLSGPRFDIALKTKIALRDIYNDEIIWLKKNWGIDYSEHTYTSTCTDALIISQQQLTELSGIYQQSSTVIKDLIFEYLRSTAEQQIEADIAFAAGNASEHQVKNEAAFSYTFADHILTMPLNRLAEVDSASIDHQITELLRSNNDTQSLFSSMKSVLRTSPYAPVIRKTVRNLHHRIRNSL